MTMHLYQKVLFAAVLGAAIILYCFFRLFPFDTGQPYMRLLWNPHISPFKDQNSTEQLQTFSRRRQRVQQECEARRRDFRGRHLDMDPSLYLVDYRHELLFCSIPKNGCSFWKRVFSILNGSHQGSRVFNLSGTAIHRTAGSYPSLARYHNSLPSIHYLLQTFTTVMFVRDPYERLFSGYVDKFFSPGTFLKLESKIVKEFRGKEADRACHRGVNFTEFLEYVTNQRGFRVNPHFDRQHTCCSPCHIQYDFIGKFETFHEDADFILEVLAHLDSETVWGPGDRFEESSDVNIMNDIIARTWQNAPSSGKECLSPYSRMLRLWITFQVRGFLSIKQKLPLSKKEAVNTSKEGFRALVLQAYRASGDRAIVKLQRKQAVQEAFRSVPYWLLQRVEQFVAQDCRLFGYECSLPLRFHLDSPKPRPIFHMHEALEE